jgi:hypothetical protein
MYQLFQKEVRYLGHIISPEGETTAPEKLEAEQPWPQPRDKHELRSFLGLFTSFWTSNAGCAKITKSLTQFSEAKRTYQWSPEADAAFRALKDALCTAPVLGYPRLWHKFIVDTDASNVGVGGLVSQVQEGQEQAVASFSNTL